MSLEATLERVSAIRQALADPAALAGAGAGVTGGTQAPSGASATAATGGSSFAAALEQASGGEGTPAGETSATAPGAQLEDAATTADALGASTAQMLGSGSGAGTLATSMGAGALATGTPAALDSPYSLTSFDGVAGSLDGVAGASPLSATGMAGESTPGGRMVAIAESQLGQTEQPPGSNESPAIAQYRTATAGSVPGAPWCSYFASWVARQAGAPIGEGGQGAGAVSEVWSWAQSAGRAIPNGPGVVPKQGDLIVFGDEHVGIVRDVLPNGQIQTIEGNYENKVAANVRLPTEATGYVEMS
jgi:CHAP domain